MTPCVSYVCCLSSHPPSVSCTWTFTRAHLGGNDFVGRRIIPRDGRPYGICVLRGSPNGAARPRRMEFYVNGAVVVSPAFGGCRAFDDHESRRVPDAGSRNVRAAATIRS
jgi:hypothetical protein